MVGGQNIVTVGEKKENKCVVRCLNKTYVDLAT